ncbi:hypothetical protein BC629DRAFT_1599394 [Irpex lacteus]|nr:hypothetical protein BC629DRAFT_1599394 [Irpex lacteus]
MSLESLPADLLLDIASYLTDRGERLQLSLTSTLIYPKVIPSVYDTVKLAGSSQCLHTLAMLRDTPSLARHVQSLEIYPDHSPRLGRRDLEDQDLLNLISALVAEVAPSMDALQTFVWGFSSGESVNAMWNALRQSCPKLKCLSSGVSEASSSCDSALSEFNGLQSFALRALPAQSDTPAAVSEQQLNMLIHECPELETLTLDCVVESDLSSANWPHLRNLNLDSNSNISQTLIPFLERHASIERLSLHPSNPDDLSPLSEDALPGLKHFAGSVNHLTSLCCRGQSPQGYAGTSRFSLEHPQAQFPLSHPLSRSLESLAVMECIPVQQLTPFAMYSMLVGLKKLTSLKLKFDADGEYDSGAVLKTIVAARPELEELDVSFVGKESISMDAFHKILCRLKKLHKLSLTVVQFPGDESLAHTARRFVQIIPRLTDIHITYIPSGAAPATSEDIDYTQKAHFTIEHNVHNIPVTMYSVEHVSAAKLDVWPPLPVRRTCTKTTYDLRASQQPHQVRRRSESSPVRGAVSKPGLDPKFSVLSALLLMATVWGSGVAIDCL